MLQQTSPISFPSERTKQLLLTKFHHSLFQTRNYGIANKKVFSLFSHLLSEESNFSSNGSIQSFTTYNSFIALKTIYLEENRPENLLSSYLEIDLMEKIKMELSDNAHEILKVVAYRNIPLALHRNIRVIEILYERTLSFYYPLIIKECPFMQEDDEEPEIEDNYFHKVFDFVKNRFSLFQGNILHELNCKYGEFKMDVSPTLCRAKIHVFFKQHVARRFFYELVPYLDQYVMKHYQHFSLEKIWCEYLLSSFFRILGNEKKALEKLETIYDLFQRIYGPEQLENSDILLSLSNIVALKNQELALEHMEKAVRLRLKYLGPDHLKVAYAYMQLGSLLLAMKFLDRAMVYFEKALKGFEKHYTEDYPWDSLGYTLFSLGNIHFEKKNLNAACFYFKASWRAYNNFIIPNDIMVVTILGILNKICGEKGNFVEGYIYLMQGLKIIKHGFGIESEKYKGMKKNIKGQNKTFEILRMVKTAWALDKNLRKTKVFKRKEIISDILTKFSF